MGNRKSPPLAVWIVAGIILLLPAGLLVRFTLRSVPHLPPPTPPDSTQVFCLKRAGWQPAAGLEGVAADFKVSPAGVVWVSTRSQGGLSRLDGNSWTRFQGSDFGAGAGLFGGGLTLLDEELWGATEEGVVRFDGLHWKLYPEALKSRQPVSIVAGRSGVWVLDLSGNLSRFDGARWTVTNLVESLLGLHWSGTPASGKPALALPREDWPWLVWEGLWRFDGKEWREVRPDGAGLPNARLLGQDPDRLWLLDGDRVKAVTSSGAVAASYTRADLGISDTAPISRIAAAGGLLLMATGDGVLESDGGFWRRLASPLGAPAVVDAGLAADGTVWIATERTGSGGVHTTAPPLNVGRILLLSLPGLVLAAVGLLLLSRLRRARRARESEARAVVEQAAGSHPAPPIDSSGPFGGDSVFGPAAGRAKTQPPDGKYPMTPVWPPALAYAAAGGIWIALSLVIPKEAAGLVVLALAIAVIFGLNRFARGPLVRGEYDRGLRRLRFVEYLLPTHSLITLRGDGFLAAGRPKEAEAAFRLVLADSQGADSITTRAYALCHLADALMDQGRYEEARLSLEGAMKLRTPVGVEYAGMADLLLLQGIEPQKALGFIDQAIAIRFGPSQGIDLQKALGRVSVQVPDGEIWASKAWSLALLGRCNEAEEAARHALRAADPGFVHALAGTHWRLGMASLAMERHEEAMDRFRRVRDIDPHGKYATLAAEALAKHSAWGVRR